MKIGLLTEIVLSNSKRLLQKKKNGKSGIEDCMKDSYTTKDMMQKATKNIKELVRTDTQREDDEQMK